MIGNMKRFWLSIGIFFCTLLCPFALPVFLYLCYKNKFTIWQSLMPIIIAIFICCLIFVLYAWWYMWDMNNFCDSAEQNGLF
jgi:hypothetical protein